MRARDRVELYFKDNVKGKSLLILRLKALHKLFGDVEIKDGIVDNWCILDIKNMLFQNNQAQYLLSMNGDRSVYGVTRLLKLLDQYNVPRDPRDLALIIVM